MSYDTILLLSMAFCVTATWYLPPVGGLTASTLPQPAVLAEGALHPKIAWPCLPDMPIVDKTVKRLADLR